MAQTLARRLGAALRPIRPGTPSLASRSSAFAHAPGRIVLDSPAFRHGGEMDARFTADGAGVSPPLSWSGVPEGARSLVLLVEDADIPFIRPLTHLILHGIPPATTSLPEGAVGRRQRAPLADGSAAGRNGMGIVGWLPPSPPPGHGAHRYAFQLFALNAAPRFDWPPGRGYLLRAMKGQVIARGTLIGRYERR